AFTDIKGVDWDELKEEFMPRFEAAEEDGDVLEYRRALMEFSWRIPDGHISMGVVIEDFRAAVEGGIGLGIRDVDDGRIIVNFLTEGGPAQAAGIELGAEVVSIDGITATVAVDDAQPFSAPFSTEHVRRLQKLRYAIRFPANTDVEIGYVNPESTELVTTTLSTVPEFDSFNQSSQNAGITGIELPVEFDILDSGYGYVAVSSFIDNSLLTIQLWERMIQTMNDRAIPGLVIDMRQNGGGSGSLANSMAGYFFEESVVVGNSEIFDEDTGEFLIKPENERKSLVPPDRSLFYGGDVVVLVGPACASACEFFSYNMTINDRATVVGQYPSAGLGGSVSDLQMPEGVTVRYTVGRAVDPDGEIHIEGFGVRPDVDVPVTEETLFTDEDVVLNQAVSLLEGGLRLTDPEPAESDLVVGDIISGSLDSGAVDTYSLFVEEGMIVSIFADAESQKDLDLALRLLDPDGVLILENDDLTAKTLNAGLEDLEIPFDLTLIIEVTSINEDDSGLYTLRVVQVNAPEGDGEDAGSEDSDGDAADEEDGEASDESDGDEEDDASEDGESEDGDDESSDDASDEDTDDEDSDG
ncbi:MAG: S41 family peptidase, partial [Chloroflexota bacterium]